MSSYNELDKENERLTASINHNLNANIIFNTEDSTDDSNILIPPTTSSKASYPSPTNNFPTFNPSTDTPTVSSPPKSHTPLTLSNSFSRSLRKKYNKRKKKRLLQTTLHRSFTSSNKEDLSIQHGDEFTPNNKEPNTYRFLTHNTDGLFSVNDSGKFDDLRTQFHNYKIDCFANNESKVNPTGPFATDSKIKFDRDFPNGLLTHTNTKKSKQNSYDIQYGGVSTMLSPDLNRKSQSVVHDSYGRWHTHKFFLKDNLLEVKNIYRPNKDDKHLLKSAYSEQKFQYNLERREGCPRELIIEDLEKELKATIKAKNMIIVMADANEGYHHKKRTFLDMMDTLGFVNLLAHKFGQHNIPKTYLYGPGAIDHVWVSAALLPYITRICILAANEFAVSTHRGVGFDLNIQGIMSHQADPLSSFAKRRLHAGVPKSKKAYNEHIDYQLEHQCVATTAEKLDKMETDDTSWEDQCSRLENFDKQLAEIKLSAENNLPYIHSKSFTSKLAKAKINRYKLRRRLRELRNKKRDTMDRIDPFEVRMIKEELKEIKSFLDQHDIDGAQMRDEELKEKADDLVQQGKFKEQATALKVIRNTEKVQKDAYKLQKAVNLTKKGGLSYIEIPSKKEYKGTDKENYKDIDTIWNRIEVAQGDDVNDWESITTKEDIEKMMIKWSQRHFTQANTTPLANPKWISLLDEATSFNDIKSEAEKLQPEAKALLEELFPITSPSAQTAALPTLEDWQNFIDSKDERTSCSPAGIHYGHFKASRGTKIEEYTYKVIYHSLRLGYIPTRWKKTITTLIAKKLGVFYIHRLRPLHVVEPEVQFISNFGWAKELMTMAEEHNLITDSQYGGRKGRQAQNAVIKQVALWDIAKLQNRKMASHMADARANFDRNMFHIVKRILLSMGMNPTLVSFYQKFLNTQVFHIRTAYGISSEYYSNDPDNPLFGDGQGIGWSSVNQIMVSSIIDRVCNKLGTKFDISSTDDVYKIISGTNFFIDDRISNTIHDNLDQLLQDFQQNESIQVAALNAAGGAIAPIKCAWWLLDRKKGDFNIKLCSSVAKHAKLKLANTNDRTYNIKRLNPSDAERYLGVLITPTYTSTAQVKVLKQKIKTWCASITNAYITKRLILKSYNTQLVPQLQYPLVATDLSFEQADALMRPIRVLFSRKTQQHRGTPLNVTHGPSSWFGEDLTHIYDLSGREKLHFLTSHVRNNLNKDDTVYDCLMTSFQDHQLNLGHISNFLNLDYNIWAPVLGTRTWFLSVWDYLSFYNNKIDIININTYNLPRNNDFYLMEMILKKEKSLSNILKFNRVRMHFELLTAADVATLDGSSIHHDYLHQSNITSTTSEYNWPVKEIIPNNWLTTFRHMLSTHIEKHIIKNPLGEWISPSHQKRSTLKLNDDTLIYNNKVYKRGRSSRYHLTNNDPPPSSSCQIADIEYINSTTVKHTLPSSSPHTSLKSTPTNLPKTSDRPKTTVIHPQYPHAHEGSCVKPSLPPAGTHIKVIRTPIMHRKTRTNKLRHLHTDPLTISIEDTQQHWYKEAWGLFYLTPQQLKDIHYKVKSGFIVVSDGGNPDDVDYSTYGWSIGDLDGNLIYKNGGVIGGLCDDQDSHRAEAYGAYAALSFINYLDSLFDDLSADRKFYCDNDQITRLVPTFFVNPKRNASTKRHFDIQTEVQHELKRHKFPIRINYVKGHQDRHKTWDQLSPAEKMNVTADRMCHAAHHLVQSNPTDYPIQQVTTFFQAQGISLRSESHRHVTGGANTCHLDTTTNNIIHELRERHNISDEQFHIISWDTIRNVSKSLSHFERRKFQKILYEKWYTKKAQFIIGHATNDLCPLCHVETESCHHVMHCPHPSALGHRSVSLNKLLRDLSAADAPECLIDFISHSLSTNSSNDFDPSTYYTKSPKATSYLLQALTDHDIIKTHNLHYGFLSKRWIRVLQADFKINNIENAFPSHCLSKISLALLSYTHSIWCQRCEKNKDSSDNFITLYREKLHTIFKDLSANIWKVGVFTDLVHRSEDLFITGSRRQLEIWEHNVQVAIQKTKSHNIKNPQKTLTNRYNFTYIRLSRRRKGTKRRRLTKSRKASRRKTARLKAIRHSSILPYLQLRETNTTSETPIILSDSIMLTPSSSIITTTAPIPISSNDSTLISIPIPPKSTASLHTASTSSLIAGCRRFRTSCHYTSSITFPSSSSISSSISDITTTLRNSLPSLQYTLTSFLRPPREPPDK